GHSSSRTGPTSMAGRRFAGRRRRLPPPAGAARSPPLRALDRRGHLPGQGRPGRAGAGLDRAPGLGRSGARGAGCPVLCRADGATGLVRPARERRAGRRLLALAPGAAAGGGPGGGAVLRHLLGDPLLRLAGHAEPVRGAGGRRSDRVGPAVPAAAHPVAAAAGRSRGRPGRPGPSDRQCAAGRPDGAGRAGRSTAARLPARRRPGRRRASGLAALAGRGLAALRRAAGPAARSGDQRSAGSGASAHQRRHGAADAGRLPAVLLLRRPCRRGGRAAAAAQRLGDRRPAGRRGGPVACRSAGTAAGDAAGHRAGRRAGWLLPAAAVLHHPAFPAARPGSAVPAGRRRGRPAADRQPRTATDVAGRPGRRRGRGAPRPDAAAGRADAPGGPAGPDPGAAAGRRGPSTHRRPTMPGAGHRAPRDQLLPSLRRPDQTSGKATAFGLPPGAGGAADGGGHRPRGPGGRQLPGPLDPGTRRGPAGALAGLPPTRRGL
ncbi:MAG: hypothetical protein AVDCRST_MAG61-292, partial [uncultured Friedmanniella sp.]